MSKGPIIADTVLEELKVLSQDTVVITLKRPPEMDEPLPGQFVRLKIMDYYLLNSPAPPFRPLFDRPFSFHRSEGTHLHFLIREVGPGTGLFRELPKGAQLRLTGPLGKGPVELARGSGPLVMVAGGAGMGPMGILKGRGFSPLILLYGERTASSQMERSYVEGLAEELIAVTEDGSGYGGKGLVTQPLMEVLARLGKSATVYACGPTGLLVEVERICKENQNPLFVAAEAFMACGLGVCLTCSQETTSGKRARLCLEGPVFPGGTLIYPS
ncbi:MAG: hypothetical protein LBE27_06025 [Deltaproteobacteria bacterium]|jgi:dihydroorotate dehydrogenase electron transfer subunit|nr:hypothetical protein [Deltaproteobacteria bacterium]